MASVREIAKRVGVSAATVSRAMNDASRVRPELRRKVLAAVNRARYIPKVGTRVTNYYVAFAYAGECSMGSPFDAAIVHGISERMAEHGFDLVILDLARARFAGETFSQMFLRKGIRGAILRTSAATRHVCEAIAAEHFPAVVVGDRFPSKSLSFIYSDSRESSRAAVDHLVALGHRQIAFSFNSIDDSDHADRLAGYRAALESHGIAYEQRLVLQANASRGGGVQLIRRICGSTQQRPTAIYIADPLTAASAIGEAQTLGLRVPQDLSIVGFDDGDLRFLARPHMTAVCQDAAAIGREAARTLHELIARPDANSVLRATLPTTFEIHESTAPPPARSSNVSSDSKLPRKGRKRALT